MDTILKGIIIEIKDDYIIALKNSGDMVKIKNKGSCKVGDSIMFFYEDIIELENKENGKVITFKKFIMPIVAIATICLIFLGNITNILLTTKGYAVVSMDINPSLQLELNNDEKIIEVKSLNKDAESLFDCVKGMELKVGMEKIKEILIANDYTLDNSDMLIGFTFINGNNNKEYEEGLKRTIKDVFKTSNIAYIKGAERDLEESEMKGISLGRYEAEVDLDDLDLEDDDVSFIIEQLKRENKLKILGEDSLDGFEDVSDEGLEESSSDKDDDLEGEEDVENNNIESADYGDDKQNDEKNDDYVDSQDEDETTKYEEVEENNDGDEISGEDDESDNLEEDDD